MYIVKRTSRSLRFHYSLTLSMNNDNWFFCQGVPAAQLVGRRSCRRGQTAGGGSIPRWSTGKPQVVTRRKATGAGQKKTLDSCAIAKTSTPGGKKGRGKASDKGKGKGRGRCALKGLTLVTSTTWHLSADDVLISFIRAIGEIRFLFPFPPSRTIC